jgi:hypothetical protein
MTPGALSDLKKLDARTLQACQVRADRYRSLVCDNKRLFSTAFLGELNDLTARLTAEGFGFNEQSWRIYEDHIAGWPEGFTCKMQPNIGFSDWDGHAGIRIGFGVNVNPIVSTDGAVHLAELHDRARKGPADFNWLGVELGGWVETPIRGYGGRHCTFMDAVPPGGSSIDVDWWFYGGLATWPVDQGLIADNQALAAKLKRAIERTRLRGFWVGS